MFGQSPSRKRDDCSHGKPEIQLFQQEIHLQMVRFLLLCWFTGMYFCEFPPVFFSGTFFLLLKIIARSFQLSPSTQKFPGSWGQSQQNILVIHLPSLGPQWQGDTSSWVNLMGTGKAPKKTAHIFGRVQVDIFGLQKRCIYISISAYLISSMRNETTF